MIRDFIKKHKAGTIFLGDICIYFVSLTLMLLIRYGGRAFFGAFAVHKGPFSVLLILWLLVFYVADLYTYTAWRPTQKSAQLFGIAILFNFFLSISVFYLFGTFFKLTPKINLIIFTGIFAVLDCAWRFLLARALASARQAQTVVILANSKLAKIIIEHGKKHPQLGYIMHHHTSLETALRAIGHDTKACIVLDDSFIRDAHVMETIYGKMAAQETKTLAVFYEIVLGRVPLSEIGETWFLTEVKDEDRLYAALKRALDICLALAGIIFFSPVFLILFVLIPITSHGSAIYAQKRIGKNGKPFMLYKFRTMHMNAEKSGAVWSTENDSRVTRLGAFLRKSHLDELPQLVNILWGNLAFVGPRPERPEFIATLIEKVPFYMVRQTMQPGLTGWAQINHDYGGSIEGTTQKLEYDIYYLKHRSVIFDLVIILKTIRKIF